MLKFVANGKTGKKSITLPTSIKEITPDYLVAITNEILVADNYSLIALCHKEKLSSFILAGRNKKNQVNTSVVPLFVKRGAPSPGRTYTSFESNFTAGDKLIITPSDMMTGLHVRVPMNTLTVEGFLNAIDGDGYAFQNATKNASDVYFLEFKIVPNCAIQGVYKSTLREQFDNPFQMIDVSETNEGGVD